ncbi:MAG: Mut7-C RNAse domain-containing protein [Holophaga sp.]|jgi:hypothetical protein
MAQALFRFYAELNELLPLKGRHQDRPHTFRPPATLKDRIEAQGIPHTEVDLVLVNGAPAGFDHRLQDGDRVSVYPYLATVPSPLPLRPPYPRGRFVLDQHLARLAAYLRLLGLDTAHWASMEDAALARISAAEDRVLLTRDKGLLMRRTVVHGGFVRARMPREQVVEVLHRFGASERIAPFTRCMVCNELLEPAAREAVLDRLPPDTREAYDRFWTCPACRRVFWEGPHVRRMRSWVEAWLAHPDVARTPKKSVIQETTADD